jgi:hypothetical protein
VRPRINIAGILDAAVMRAIPRPTVELATCFTIADTGNGRVIRCRHCSAGWLPNRTDDITETLIEHARTAHRTECAPARLHTGQRHHSPNQERTLPDVVIPSDAKPISDQRLTLIRVISTLRDRLVEGDGGLKARVKRTMLEKEARYAESDLVIAELRPGSTKGPIDPAALYELVELKQLSLAQFLQCITVQKEPLKKFLAGGVIDRLTSAIPNPPPHLFTDFRQGVEFNVDRLAEQLAPAIAKAVPIKAA